MLRLALPSDSPAIALLHMASWRTAYRGMLPDAYLDGIDPVAHAAGWQKRLAEAATTVLVLEEAGALLGFCACGPALDADRDPARTWQIRNLHVDPTLKRQGFGGQLLDEASALGRAAARTTLVLWVVAANAPARRFYEKKGMALDGVTRRHPFATDVLIDEVRYASSL